MATACFDISSSRRWPRRRKPFRRRPLELEALETRTLLSGSSGAALHPLAFVNGINASTPLAGAFPPASIKKAYGINLLTGDGTGVTIAIIGAFDDPKLVSSGQSGFLTSDLHQFDMQYSLSEPTGFFTKYSQTGSQTSFPVTDPALPGNQNWEGEEALDVEWAHALAPGATIELVEASDGSANNLFPAANWAATPVSGGGGGAQVVCMGWGQSEVAGEKTYDTTYLTQPAGYGVTYLAASGDGGTPGNYPAYYPDVIAVGGTSLSVDSSGNYSVESGWTNSGGGISSFEPAPVFQASLGYSGRSTPDVSFVGGDTTPVSVYDSYNGLSKPWYEFYGTSVGTPCWSALIGIADQLRANQGLSSLNGPAQVLPMLYTLPSTDFHDITSGNNGYSAGPGYDLVTGQGTPIANKLVPDLTALRVDSSTPASGIVLATQPNTFNVTFTDPINPSSLHANALTINGIASNGVSLDSTDMVATFTFASNPVTGQGPQTMALAAGAVTSLTSSSRTNAAYNATFYYDTLPLAITSTTPTPGGSFSLPAGSLSYTVTFNQPIDPKLAKTSNLILTPSATVSSVVVQPGNQAVTYTLTGSSLNTVGPLTVNIAAGTFKDQYDDPGSPPNFAATYYLEKMVQAFPAPTSTNPSGSLIYSTTGSNQLLFAGDSNRFTLSADPGQTLTVLVTPTSSAFTPTVQLSDPSNAVLASATGSGVGLNTLLQTVATTTSGTYTVTVGGVGNGIGSYTVQVYLNTALETANLGFGTDTWRAAAQSLNAAFVNLQTSLSSASRAAVIGGVAQPVTLTASAYGDWDSTGYHSSSGPSFLVGQVPPKQYNDFFVFNLAGINPTIVSASLNLSVGPAGYNSSQTSDTFGLFDVSTPINALVANGYGQPGIFTDLGTGSSYGSKTVTSAVNNTMLSTTLNAAGLAALNAQRGSQFAVGGSLTTVTGSNTQDLFYGSGSGSDTIQLALTLADTRFYSFSLAAQELATVALKNLTGSGGETISIQDANGNVLATGSAGTNVDQLISNFVAPAAGTYYVVVSGSNNSTYSLVVTRDGTFDQKSNTTLSAAQNLTGTAGVVGALQSYPAPDWYKVTLSSSPVQNALQLETRTPLGGPSQTINTLNPSIGLYNGSGTLLAGGTVLADGRNQSLLATGLTPGATYYIQVNAANGKTGEYFLGIASLQTPALTGSPTSQSVVAGQPVTFSAAAQGSPAPTVQWQVSTNGGSSYTPISGATSPTLTISSTSTSQSGSLYEAVFTNPAGSVTTAPATLTVTPTPVFSQYLVTALTSSSTITAGNSFALQVQAADQFGNPLTGGYTGPSSVTVTLIPPSTASGFPTTIKINSNGVGWAVVSLVQVGTYTIIATGGAYSGSAAPLTVVPAPAAKLAFGVQPVNTPTGNLLPAVTVQIEDQYGNLITSDSTDQVTLGIASGPGAPGFKSGSTTTATAVGGVATFANLTLITPGVYQFSENVPALYTGPNSTAFLIAPLQVLPASFAGTPSGFSLQFNAPFLVNSVNPVLYGLGFGTNALVPSATLTQIKDGSGNAVHQAIEGSLVLNPASNSISFVATNTGQVANFNTPVLADGTYQVDLTSSAAKDGFQALNSGGGFLDGPGTGTAGSGDYLATFTVHTAGQDVVWIPATADGPGQPLEAPGMNQAGGGYPLYLDDSSGAVTSVQVTLNYNSALLTVTGVSGAGFSLLSSSTPGQAVLQYSGPALAAGVQTPIGFVSATVPMGSTSSLMPYKAKDLLTLTGLTVSGTHGAVSAVVDNALHLVAYVGDADGNGTYSSNDAVTVTRVSLQSDSGFTAYPLVDPVIVGDTDGYGFIPADAALQANEAGVGFHTANLPTPAIPANVHFVPIANNVDPTLSVGRGAWSVGRDGMDTVTVAVNIDDAYPEGSTGLVEGHLALRYDPSQLTVSAGDVHLGSVLAAGSGWSVTPSINPMTGEIALTLSSTTPIISTAGGSLVTIDFHAVGGIANPSSPTLVSSVNPSGAQIVTTELEDAQGTFTLTFGPGSSAGSFASPVTVVSSPTLGAVLNLGATEQAPLGGSISLPAATDEIDSVIMVGASPAAVQAESGTSEPPAAIPEPARTASAGTHAAAAVVASAISGFAGLNVLALNGVVLQVAGNFGASSPFAGNPPAVQRPADLFFQALARLAGQDGLPASALLSPASADASDGLDDYPVGQVADWQASINTMNRGSRTDPESKRPVQTPAEPAAADQATLDEYFAQMLTDLAEGGEE